MTDHHTITRRKLLASLGTIGLASASTGVGTMAYLNDPEPIENNLLQAGTLDLGIDWQEGYNGERIEAFPDEDDDGVQDTDLGKYERFGDLPDALYSDRRTASSFGDPLIKLDDVKPGDWGEVTFSLHPFGNDAVIWMNGRLRYASENGVPEPEYEHPDEDASRGGDRVELLDAIRVTVWYDDCDNVLKDGETVIFEDVSLRCALEHLGTDHPRGLVLDSDLNGDASVPVFSPGTCPRTGYDDVLQTGDSYTVDGETRTVPTNPKCPDFGLEQALKLDPTEPGAEPFPGPGNTATYTTPYGDVQVEQVGQQIRWRTDTPPDGSFQDTGEGFCISKVIVKGGSQGANVYEYDGNGPGSSGDDALLETPTGQDLSHVDFCVSLAERPPDGDDDPNCFPASHDQCIGFEWELPADVGNWVQTDRVAFDVGFYAEQCRHNDAASPAGDP